MKALHIRRGPVSPYLDRPPRRSASAPSRLACKPPVDYKDVKEGGLRFLVRKFAKNPRFIHVDHTSCHSISLKKGDSKGGWLGLWIRECGSGPLTLCAFEGCKKEAILGAHVRYSGSTSKFGSWYIVPACSTCNRQHSRGGKLKNGSRLLKVVDGKIFGKTKILYGRVDVNKASELIDAAKEKGEYSHSLVDSCRSWLKIKPSESVVREWPKRRKLGWGWSSVTS
jgi:hypothetical protein